MPFLSFFFPPPPPNQDVIFFIHQIKEKNKQTNRKKPSVDKGVGEHLLGY